jgi:hypothetical protein
MKFLGRLFTVRRSAVAASHKPLPDACNAVRRAQSAACVQKALSMGLQDSFVVR